MSLARAGPGGGPRHALRSRSPHPRAATWMRTVAGFLLAGLGLAGLVLDRFWAAWLPWDPTWAVRCCALAVTVSLCYALAARTGGHPALSALLALGLGAAAVATHSPVLLAGMALASAVLAAVLGVLATVPATTLPAAVVEIVVAAAVAAAGALAADGYAVALARTRFAYVALGAALLGALALVLRLGGRHGLGRRGALTVVGGLVLLAVTLAYTEALSHWGSPALIARVDTVTARVEALLGAVPPPMELLLGFPALVWGCYLRALRRQGWWVCAFGVAATASVAATPLGTDRVGEHALGLGYAALVGLLLGYAVVRADRAFTGRRGRRVRGLDEVSLQRAEPGRLHPLQ